MIREYFNNEKNIMDSFRLLSNPDFTTRFSHPLFIPDTDIVKKIYLSICEDTQWTKWSDSSGKNELPPDYYNNELKLMMEIMRVDDNAHIDESTQKLIDPIRKRESEMICELRDKGIFSAFSTIENMMVTAKTYLQTDEDHNYKFYRDNFMRIIEKHNEKIPLYLQNHPGYKIIFFVFDESSTYKKLADGYSKRSLNKNGDVVPGNLHIWWLDEAFLNTVLKSEIDFFIWTTPYKQATHNENVKLEIPAVCVFDIKNMNLETISYKERRMVSNEI